jgi:hypothetical protein
MISCAMETVSVSSIRTDLCNSLFLVKKTITTNFGKKKSVYEVE